VSSCRPACKKEEGGFEYNTPQYMCKEVRTKKRRKKKKNRARGDTSEKTEEKGTSLAKKKKPPIPANVDKEELPKHKNICRSF